MRRIRTFGFAIAMTISCMAQAYAEVMLSVDLDAATPGIQASRSFATGQSLTASFIMNLTGSSSVSAYQFSIGFDRSELTFVSRTESFPTGFGFVETDTSNPNNLGISGSQGLLYLFGGDAGAGPVAPAGPFVVATATFTVNQALGETGDIDIFPTRLVAQGDDFLMNSTFAPIPTSQLAFNGASIVSAIPEPTSISLIGFTLMIGVVYRRRK